MTICGSVSVSHSFQQARGSLRRIRVRGVINYILGFSSLITVLQFLPTQVKAEQILLTTSSVIGGSGSWDVAAYNASGYGAQHVVDNQTGDISETGPGSFWLGRENTYTYTAYGNEYFVLDLGTEYVITQVDLFNTHNQTWNDRGTSNFVLYAANSVTNSGTNAGYGLCDPAAILSGVLAFQPVANDPLEPQTYTVGTGLPAGTTCRYLMFKAVDTHQPFGYGGFRSIGLNEIRVYGTLPAASNPSLASLVISEGILSPAFDSATTNYTVSVQRNTESLTVTPTLTGTTATLTVNGVPVSSGTPSQIVPLVIGTNTLLIVVTEQDNSTATYTIVVQREASSTLVATYMTATSIPVTDANYSATGYALSVALNFAPPPGTRLTVVNNTGPGFITGRFSNLEHGQIVTLTNNCRQYFFVANYYGGTGNDLVLEWAETGVFAWGMGTDGQLGNGGTQNSNTPSVVDGSTVLSNKNVLAVAAGKWHSMALCSDGTVAAWGSNSSGQLGNGTTTDSAIPVAVDLSGVLSNKNVVAVAVGENHSLALCSDGTVFSWGLNSCGQLGNGTLDSSNVPVPVFSAGALLGKTVTAVAAGQKHSLALCSDGTLIACGDNVYGVLGIGNQTVGASPLPVPVLSSGVLSNKTVTAIAVGQGHNLALCSDGTIAAWGQNFESQLGDNSAINRDAPVSVFTNGLLWGKTVTSIAAGGYHSLALCSDGTLASWGKNNYGQLGNSSIVGLSSPGVLSISEALSGKSVSAITAGEFHSFALCSDGTLAGWGWNGFGQLGTNVFSWSAIPVSFPVFGNGSVFTKQATGSSASHSVSLVASPLSGNAQLSTLEITSAVLTTGFASNVTAYSASVPLETASVTVTPTAADVTSTVTVNEMTVLSGQASPAIALQSGINTLSIMVRAQNGVLKTYTVTLLRGPLEAVFTAPSAIPVTAAAFTATGLGVNMSLGYAPETGTSLTLIKNTGRDFINGTFSNLSQGQLVTLPYHNATYRFVVNYWGGTGNDLVLQWADCQPYAWGLNPYGALGNNSTVNSAVPSPVVTSGVLSGKKIISAATGYLHSLALCSDGTLAAWGSNALGQLGDASTSDSSVPVAVASSGVLSGKRVVALGAGWHHSLALCSDGSLAAWGSNASGQLGDNSGLNSTIPVRVNTNGILSGKCVIAVATGDRHNLALCSDGTLAAWGANEHGQLGNDSTVDSTIPVAISGFSNGSEMTVIAIGAGYAHSLALCSDGTLFAWGLNSNGQLGDGCTDDSDSPSAVSTEGILSNKTVVGIASGAFHNLALCSDGTVVAWGRNGYGQLGNATLTDSTRPVCVTVSEALSGKTIRFLRAGSNHSLALCSDGSLVGWGDNAFGQLGGFEGSYSHTPVTIGEPTSGTGMKWALLACGASSDHVFALTALPLSGDSRLSTLTCSPCTLNPTFSSNIKEYSAAAASDTTALTLTATVSDANATLTVNGVLAVSGIASPSLPLTPGVNLFSIVVTAPTGIATTSTVTVVRGPLDVVFESPYTVPLSLPCFTAEGLVANVALNFAPVVGQQLTLVNNTGPGFIAGELGNLAHGQSVFLVHDTVTYRFVVNYYGGSGNDLVLQWADGKAYAWGSNQYGQLGNGSTTNASSPVPLDASGVLGGKTLTVLAAGGTHNLAICSDGTLAAWGLNMYGQLGNSNTTNARIPVLVDTTGVLSGKTVVSLAAGELHSLALCSDGAVFSWGGNDFGQLGNASTLSSSTPVQVSTASVLAGKTVTAIAAGYGHCLALCSDGTLAAWGKNDYGQLGDGTLNDSDVPVAVSFGGMLTNRTVVAIASGGFHNLALCSDGTLVAWGCNDNGQLGNGNTTDSSVPVSVYRGTALANKEVVAMVAGWKTSLALCSDSTIAQWGEACSLVPQNTNVNANPLFYDRSVVMLAAGVNNAFALSPEGLLVAWGNNAWGQLGNGSTNSSTGPVSVSESSLGAGEKFMRLMQGGSSALHSLAWVACPSCRLGGLTVSAGTLEPLFNPDKRHYSVTVPAEATDLTVSPTATAVSDMVRVNGSVVPSGTPSQSISLLEGKTLIEITVESPDGRKASYIITAVRGNVPAVLASSSDAPIRSEGFMASGLSLDLSLAFAPPVGATLCVLNNTSPGFISGYFSNLAQGQSVTLAYNNRIYRFVANYYGGTGNDLVLQWASNKVYAWGRNDFGQLGTGGTGLSLVQMSVDATGVLSNRTLLATAAGASHSLALCSDGTLAAWGFNNAGQLGNGTTGNSSMPVAVLASGVLAGKTVVAIAAGLSHSLALCSDGTLAAWGQNDSGQLGNGSYSNSNVPIVINVFGVLTGKTVTHIAAGARHSLALCSDGSLAAWGLNEAGQLGMEGLYTRNVPTALSTFGVLQGKTVVAIRAGSSHSLALCSDGTVAAWGSNQFGQLGNTHDYCVWNSCFPVNVQALDSLSWGRGTAIAAGGLHTLSLSSDGRIAGCGKYYGVSPCLVSGILSGRDVTTLVAGEQHSLALCSDGQLTAWGVNDSGQLGNDSVGGVIMTPIMTSLENLAAGDRVMALGSGSSANHSLALVGCPFSSNACLTALSVSKGLLCPDFSTTCTDYTLSVTSTVTSITLTPTAGDLKGTVTVNGTTVVSSSASPSIPLATGTNAVLVQVTAEDGTIRSYTVSVTRGVLPAAFSSKATIPLSAPGYRASGLAIDLSLNFEPASGSCLTVINNTGTDFVKGMFSNVVHGQTVSLSYNNRIYRFIANYFGGNGNDLVLQWADVTLYAWGLNNYGQNGNGSTTNSCRPVPVISGGALAGRTVLAASISGAHTLAACADGSRIVWGDNACYQLGTGNNVSRTEPFGVIPAGALYGRKIISFAAANYHSLALCTDGTVAAWGINGYGQLGNNSTQDRSTPSMVTATGTLAGKTVIALAAGYYHSLALCSDGTIAAWGWNAIGQLGDGTTTSRVSPVAVTRSGVLNGKTVVAIAAGQYYSLALCSDGTVAGWGANGFGQLGNGTTADSPVPVLVNATGALSDKKVIAISAGVSHSLALCSDGTIVAWGNNTYGQLGNRNTTNSAVPVTTVASGSLDGKTVMTISAGAYHSLALCSDGSLVAWGRNNFGQVGNSSTIDTQEPVDVLVPSGENGVIFTALAHGSFENNPLAWAAIPFKPFNYIDTGTSIIITRCNKEGVVEIPELIDGKPVTMIASNAFSNVALTELVIPACVTNIGVNAFSGCNNLLALYFRGNAPAVITPLFGTGSLLTVYYLTDKFGWSSSFAGQPTALWNPIIQADMGLFGNASEGVRFRIAGPAGRTVVVESCQDLALGVWQPISTNLLVDGQSNFCDPSYTNRPQYFYRVRLPDPE